MVVLSTLPVLGSGNVAARTARSVGIAFAAVLSLSNRLSRKDTASKRQDRPRVGMCRTSVPSVRLAKPLPAVAPVMGHSLMTCYKSTFLNAAGRHWLHLSVRQFRDTASSKSTKKRSSVSRTSRGRLLGDWFWNLFTIIPWKSSSRRLEQLVEKAQGEEAKSMVKTAFLEGYTSSGGVTKKFLVFMLLLFLLPTVLQLYVQLGLFSDHLFTTVKEVIPQDVNVTFQDVKGVDEVKAEVMQIVDFLKNPDKYGKLGGRLPKGVLLVGPPGVGKTLLARAIAGEAGVPFFFTSGSEFDEMFVGLGAKRIRDLFAAAREKAPCVLFIDEIDSVGSRRTEQTLVTYSSQTLNQLLSEMDGFEPSEGVIVLAATNRRDDLDSALLRPGRFDIQLNLGYPSMKGRMEMFELYLSRVKASKDVSLELLARGTTGFSGADIENLVNQAALRAAADNKDEVNMKYLEEAKDNIIMGPALRHKIPDEATNRMTAYHEAGHALVSFFTKFATPMHRVTILPRRDTLGSTSFMPEHDEYDTNRAQLLARIDVLMGGRAAEELFSGFDHVSAGCASDLEKATQIALEMVQRFGMSDKFGLRVVKDSESSVFGYSKDVSATSAEVIDAEVKRILQEGYDRAKNILKTNAAAHKRIVEELLKRETLNAAEVKALIELKGDPSSLAPSAQADGLK